MSSDLGQSMCFGEAVYATLANQIGAALASRMLADACTRLEYEIGTLTRDQFRPLRREVQELLCEMVGFCAGDDIIRELDRCIMGMPMAETGAQPKDAPRGLRVPHLSAHHEQLLP